MTLFSISDKRRVVEIVAVCATAAGKIMFMDHLHWKLPFIACAIIGWTMYAIVRAKQDRNILLYWGFRRDNFRKVTMMVLPFGILSAISFFVVGYFRDTINLTWHIIPILVVYPIWGVVQQFLVVALVTGNLQDAQTLKVPKVAAVFTSAVLFGVVHYPFIWLVAGTFLLALFYGLIYLRQRNLFVLGLFHGWLGGLFFYTIVDRDPFLEVFLSTY